MFVSACAVGGSCCLPSLVRSFIVKSHALEPSCSHLDLQPRSFHVDVASLDFSADVQEDSYPDRLAALIADLRIDRRSNAAYTKDGANWAPNRIASLSAFQLLVLDNAHSGPSKPPMEGQSTTYTYSALDESRRQIRLLHLLPAAEGGNSAHDGQVNLTGTVTNRVYEIYCTFSVVSLDDHAEYEANSICVGRYRRPTKHLSR